MPIDLLLPDTHHLQCDGFTLDAAAWTVALTSTQAEAACPDCSQPSQRVHSHYQRTVADLPWAGNQVTLHLHVRRFYCANPCCPRTTFSEPLPTIVAPSARRTARLATEQRAIAQDLGGEAGARAAQRQGMPVSPDTLLRLLRCTPPAHFETPRVLGVDDWAKRKGKTYGTILVDLEQQRVVDLLPDRTAESLAAWLRERPGVEIITRDRATAYADGAARGAPKAVQVADRWHLLQNLVETVEGVLARHRRHLRRAAAVPTNPVRPDAPAATGPPYAERVRQAHRSERLARYEQALALRERGLKLSDIARTLGLSTRTVNRFLAAGGFPERKRRHSFQPGLLDGHVAYLQQRWAEGCRNGTQLWREIRGQGYAGSLSLVLNYVAPLRQGQWPAADDSASPHGLSTTPTPRCYSPRQAAVLFVRRPEALEEVEKQAIVQMTQACADIATAHALAQGFAQMIRQRQPQALEPWLERAQAAGLVEFEQFVRGLRNDKAAVLAALTYSWSSGQAEGQVNRLKLIKRQMVRRVTRRSIVPAGSQD